MGLFGKKNTESKLKVSVNKDGDTYIVLVDGRLDTLTSPQLDAELNKIIGNAKKLVLDLGKLAYISSAGLRALLSLKKNLSGSGKELEVHNLNPVCQEVFKVTGFNNILTIK